MPTHRVFVEAFTASSDMTGTRVYQSFIPDVSTTIQGVGLALVFVNSPVYTDLSVKLYSNRSGAPGALIATAPCVFTKAQIDADFTNSHKILDFLPFEFATHQSVRGGETYHWVLNGTGYTGSSTSYIGWLHGYPDPIYQTGVNMTFAKLSISPLSTAVVGAEL